MDPDQKKALDISILKHMPIWYYFEKFRAELQKFEYDFKRYLDRLEERSKRIDNLPKLNVANESRVLPFNPAANDLDIVKIYQKTENDEYILKEDQDNLRRKKRIAESNKDESIRMLEEKIKYNEEFYAMVRPGKGWVKCKVICVFCKNGGREHRPYIIFRLRMPSEHNSRAIEVSKYLVARVQDHGGALRPTKRVIAGLSRVRMLPGIVGHEPSEDNGHRYLVLMDDGSARYFRPDEVYPILGQSPHPWLDVRRTRERDNNIEAYLRHFFSSFPRRHLIKVPIGTELELMRNGILAQATVIGIDCDTIRLHYNDDIEESIYRGSPRFMKSSDIVQQQLKNVKSIDHFYNTLLINMYNYHKVSQVALNEDYYLYLSKINNFDKKIVVRGNNNKARKSTSARDKSPEKRRIRLDGELVEETKHTYEELDTDLLDKSHKCNPECLKLKGVRTEVYVTDLIGEFRNVSDLKVPCLLGWKRTLRKVIKTTRTSNKRIVVIYEAPCGKIFTADKPHILLKYLTDTGSILDIDYFSFDRDVELNRECGCLEYYHYNPNIAVDAKTGKPLENKSISLINCVDEEQLAVDFEYRSDRFPHPLLASKGFSFNEEFKSCCDCDEDCSHRVSCACHRLNEEFFGANAHNRGYIERQCQYKYKRLEKQVPTGLFECNSMCNCSSRCSNRVVQNGIRFRLQVQKTSKKGWGVYTLDDIPKGAFICTYAAELLDDADQYGDCDMYYADLDYITVNEATKEGFNDDGSDEGVDVESEDGSKENFPNPEPKGKRKDRPRISESESSDEGSKDSLSAIDAVEEASKEVRFNVKMTDKESDINPDKYMPNVPIVESRYPKRNIQQQQAQQANSRQPADSRAQNRRRPHYARIHDILGSHDYTLDARIQGNVGRFFNHSCDPNASVQNVFIETHDLRFPIVAFFASKTIKAMTEITWNYNYKINCIDGRVMVCECRSSNCKGRIL